MLIFLTQLMTATALPADEFNNLLKRVDDVSFPEEQINIITRIPSSSEITCAQVVKLLEEFSFSKDQQTVIQHLAPQISDLKNRHLILEVLTYSDDKENAGRILDEAYAEQQDALHAEQEEAREEAQQSGINKRAKRLKEWARELYEQEQELEERERKLDRREKRLEQRERKLRGLEGRIDDSQSDSPRFSWIGYCPMGINKNNVARGECMPFDDEVFNPMASYGQRLLLKVKNPGPVKLKVEQGPKMKRCKTSNSRTTVSTHVFKTKRKNEIIDVSALIDQWNVEYTTVTARRKKTAERITIADWQDCK